MYKFWIRKCEIIAGGKRFDMDDLDIKFNIPFDNNDEPDVAQATIYNLSDNSINSIKKEQNIIVNAGYEGDIGTIFKGTLQKTITRWNNTEKITDMHIGDGSQEWLRKHISVAYSGGITSMEILGDLVGRFGLELGKLELVNNLSFPKGRIIDSSLKDAIKQIVKETGTEFKISKGRIFIMPHKQGVPTGFLLNKDTGLIGSPEVFEKEEDGEIYKGYKIKMLLNHKITINSIIVVESKTANGTFRVLRGKHINNGSEFTTQIEVME